jgi:glutamine amidotransferase
VPHLLANVDALLYSKPEPLVIVIVDYGVGNLGSIGNMFRRVGVAARTSGAIGDIESASGIVLPGVGHFDHCVQRLRASGLVSVLERRVLGCGVPLLGICVGLQMLGRRSEEGRELGLGWVDAECRRFHFDGHHNLPIPHMGWADVEVSQRALFAECPPRPRFYFVHSYHLICDHESDVSAWATYGYRFVAAVHKQNLFGTQFHPEKSHKFGLGVLKSFSRIVDGCASRVA